MIERERHGEVVVLRMANGKVNALDLELLRALVEELDELERGGGPPLVLTGRGSSFSAGVDLRRIVDGGPDYVGAYLPALTTAFGTLFCYPGPAVAAVNGHAIAGGYVLAAACDHRVAADGPGRLGLSELQVGVPFPVSAIEVVRQAVGTSAAAELALGAELVDVPTAAAAGLVGEVVEPGALLRVAVERAATRAGRGLLPYRLAKRQLQQPVLERIERADDTLVRQLWAGQESRNRITAFLDGLKTV